MRRLMGIFWLGALLVAGCSTTPGVAQTPASASPEAPQADEKTIWDGVYTTEQAGRGERVAREACMSCHTQNEWAHPMFITVWSGRPIHELYENIRMTMPYDAPGRLTRDEYAEIISFILQLNSAPAGEADLPSDAEGLSAIAITPREDP